MKLPRGLQPDLRGKPLPRAYIDDRGEILRQGPPCCPPMPGWAGYVDSREQLWSFDAQGRLWASAPLPMPPAPPAQPAPPGPDVPFVPVPQPPCIHRWYHSGTNGIIMQRRCMRCGELQKIRRDEIGDLPPW